MNEINELLLETIDSIDEITMESELNVLYALYDEYNKYCSLMEYSDNFALIMESGNDVSKQDNIFVKGFKLLISIFKTIKNGIVRLFQKITKRSESDLSGVTKTVSQILKEVKTTNINEAYMVDPNDTTTFFDYYITPDGHNYFKETNASLKLKKLRDDIKAKFPIIKGIIKTKAYKDSRDMTAYLVATKFYLKYKNKINKVVTDFINIIQSLRQNENMPNEQIKELVNRWDNIIGKPDTELSDLIEISNNNDIIIREEEMKDLVTSIDSIFKELPSFEVLVVHKNIPDELHVLFDDIMALFTTIQMNVNLLFRTLEMSFSISGKYMSSMDLSELDVFVLKLIQNNYPEKYIRDLVYKAAKYELKNGSNNPKWGQTRGCLIPKNKDEVYKFALSQKGIVDNNNELKIYSFFKNQKFKSLEYIAKIKHHESNNCVMSMEKLIFYKNQKDIDETEFNNLVNVMGSELMSKGLYFSIVDIHDMNVAKRSNGNVVISDYAGISLNKNS